MKSSAPGQLALLASALDASDAAAALVDGEGAVRHLSTSARKLLGWVEHHPTQPVLLEQARARGLGVEKRELPNGWAILALSERGRRERILQIALHDLRSPLANVRSYAGLLLRGKGTADKLPRMAEVIARNTERALRLIGLYLDSELLRLGEGPMSMHLQPTPLAPIVEAAVAGRRTLASERGIQIELAPVPEATLPADGERLAAALEVVLDRALARSPDGGRIRVRVESEPGQVRVEVRDEGGAVEPGELSGDRDARILADRRLYPAVGLHLAKAALAAHGGAVELLPGNPGALWRLVLPRH